METIPKKSKKPLDTLAPVWYSLHMAKKKRVPNRAAQDLRTMAHAAYVADLRDGRRQRAVTFTDRRKQASKRACRDWKAA